ncbi:MAG: OmpH family outer membrane protein [Candidatus Cloacimonetes bacterium]|nr:OmpH family outer membrane protein [Candidatus Cloacimonadota bacterium]
MRRAILMVILALLCSSAVFAASLNIAYIDTDRVMMESQDTQEAQQLFQAEQQAWQDEIAEMDAEIQRLRDDYEQKKMILREEGKLEAENAIKDLISQRDEKVSQIFGEGGKAMQKNAELLEPILDKLKNVIEAISTDDNIDIVLDASTGGILYAVPSLDITDQVIERMNKLTDGELDN